MLQDQNSNEENQQPLATLTPVSELRPLDSTGSGTVLASKYKLEVEQRVNSRIGRMLHGINVGL